MTHPNHSPTPIPTRALTPASVQVEEEEPQQLLRETNAPESPSFCIKPTAEASNAQTRTEDANVQQNVSVPCPITTNLKPSNHETKSNHCQNLSVPNHILVTASLPNQFPLLWYFSPSSSSTINSKEKLRRKKKRIPARKLLYYTKVRTFIKGSPEDSTNVERLEKENQRISVNPCTFQEMGYYRQCFHPRKDDVK